ncbi:MAG: hypothetical protein K0S58_1848 [Nitrospira sp.]|nr:hypothetical protein [Nitrospira sp.]
MEATRTDAPSAQTTGAKPATLVTYQRYDENQCAGSQESCFAVAENTKVH